MNSEQIENQEIWKQIKGADKLFEIYTYYPSLHDAEIKNIGLNFENREFYLTVDYTDFIKEPDDAITTRIKICWRYVRKANFNCYADGLHGMKFSKKENFILTKFVDYSSGFYGEINASEIEIMDIEIEPKNNESEWEHTMKISVD